MMNYILVLAILIASTHAIIIERSIKSTNSWLFVGAYSFKEYEENDFGTLLVEAAVPCSSRYKFVLYYDSVDWDEISSKGKTCVDKIYNITTGFHLYFEMIPNVDDKNYCIHRSSYSIRTSSARYFYYAIANCLLPEECYKKYCQGYITIPRLKIEFYNGNSDLRNLEYVDFGEYYLRETMMIMYIILSVFSLVLLYALYNWKLLHFVHFTVVLSIIFALCENLIYFVYLKTAIDTETYTNAIKIVAMSFKFISESFMIMHLFMVCHGYRIIRRKIKMITRLIIITYTFSYIVIGIFSYVYFEVFIPVEIRPTSLFNHPSSAYYYIIRCIGLIWFVYGWIHTYRRYKPSEYYFKYIVIITGVIWFILPLIVYAFVSWTNTWNKIFVNDLSHSIINILFYTIIFLCIVPYYKIMSSRVSTYTFLPADEVIASTNGGESKAIYKSEIEYYFKNGIQQKIQYEVMIQKLKLKISMYYDIVQLLCRDLHLVADEIPSDNERVYNDFKTVKLNGIKE